MNFNTQNNAKDNTISMNTRGYQFMNRNGFDPSALTVGFWNEMLSLRINPALEPSKQTESKVFDYDKAVSTSLTLEKITTLLYGITKVVLPAIEAKEDKSVAISVSGDTLVAVGTGKRLTGDIRPFLAIHKSLNPDTKKPEMSIFYEFKTSDTINDYNESTGEYNLCKGIQSELILFVELLKSAIIGLSNATAHASRNVGKWQSEKLNGQISAIAEKVGAPNGFSSNTNRTFNRRPAVSFDSQSSNEPPVNVSELDNLEDLNNFLS